MAPEVLLRKLTYLRQLLADLSPYENASLAKVRAEHYKLERIFEMLVVVTTDIVNHQLAERGIIANTFRETFQLAAQENLIPDDLSEKLQDAASMRNLIVHLYERIDYSILRDSISPTLQDFQQVTTLLEQQLSDDK